MPRILLVAATTFEIQPTIHWLETSAPKNIEVVVCITGVGMVNTAFELGKLNGQLFDIAINAGIAGSFSTFNIGDVVAISEDAFAELGAEDGDGFISIDEMGFGRQSLCIANPLSSQTLASVPKAKGITVNKVHGHEASIANTVLRLQPQTESMEGAAFIHAANAFGWKAIQLRAISNRVEKRNRDAWDIPVAIKNLNEKLVELLKELSASSK